MRKGPSFVAAMYGAWRNSFLEAASIITGEYTLDGVDLADVEVRTLARYMDFEAAAGATLAAVNADPRNHFGKHALRRFDK